MRLYLFTAVLFIISQAKAQKKALLINIDDISFVSGYEKSVTEKIILDHDSTFVIEALLASSKDQNQETVNAISSKIKAIERELKEEISSQRTVQKRIKIIYAKLHNTFLKKYELEAKMSQIFTNGIYNCVTATALYAHFFQQLDIPFAIQELPTHVYLVAYPQTDKIMIETTDPTLGYFQFNDEFIKHYIAALQKAKLISQEEVSTMSANDLFNKYYFKDGKISFKQLAGIHYSNSGLYANENKDNATAFEDFKKAYLYYPSSRNQFLISQSIRNIVHDATYQSLKDIENYIFLIKFAGYSDTDISEKELAGEFSRITQELLIAKSNFTLYDDTYKKIAAAIDSSNLKNEISFIYNYESGRAYLALGKYSNAEEKLKEAYKLEPENAYVNEMLSNCFRQKVVNLNNSQKILTLTEKTVKDYPTLASNGFFKTVTSLCYLDLAYQSFYTDDIIKGENYLNKFEADAAKQTDVEFNEIYVEKAYSNAAVAYYKKGNKVKAKSAIQRGLKYSPSSERLKMLLTDIK